MNFDDAFTRLIGNEGGYVNNPADPGGETNWGISRRSYPGEDIANMTVDRAKEIYKRDYWGPSGCDIVPEALKFDMFDTAVNAGQHTAIKFLQQASGADADGILGSQTMMAVQGIEPFRLLTRFNGWRLDHLNDNPDLWAKFGRGWAQRMANNMKAV